MSDVEPVGPPVEPVSVPVAAGQPAGWYPTPEGRQRYWDGAAWTEHYAAGQQLVQRVTDQRPPNSGLTVVAWIIAVCTVGYMLPWAVAVTRGKSNHGAIAVIDLLLGWTFVGWVVALVMACGAHQSSAVLRGG